ncbi:hypothetical protein BH11BAC1_BH11BAC1_10860 [soil metagenome]
MNKKLLSYGIICLLLLSSLFVFAWGFWGHKRINNKACFTLPPEMFGFYKRHIDYITEHAVDPDKRRYSDPEEAPRHYIDLDHYNFGPHSTDSIPHYWKDAVAKMTEDTLKAYGIVPWHINVMQYRLTDAFKEGDVDRILYLSASLGHYVADAHVPLHCSENYNGQMTNQVGIHGFWESRIPEMFGENYDYFTGRVHFIAKPQEEAWKIVEASFAALDSVLTFERELNKKFPQDQKYAFEQRGATTLKVYSQEYTTAYNTMLNGMVERRMRSAIIEVGSFWYTCWVNAGSPDLSNIEHKEMSDSMKLKMKQDEEMWMKGTLQPKGHDEDH